jgi:hypothetical protein
MVIPDAILPAGLDPDIAATVTRILADARSAGWSVGPVKWLDASSRMVSCTARLSDRKSLFLMCREEGLVARLRVLLV